MAKNIKIYNLKENMYIAEDIYVKKFLIVPSYTKVTNRLIAKLRMYGIEEVSIYEEKEISERKEKLNAQTNLNIKIENSKMFKKFQHSYHHSVDKVEFQFNDIVLKSKKIEPEVLLSQVETILSNGFNDYRMLEMIQCMKGYDDSTFSHCINVALICTILGKWLKLSNEDNNILALCGLLHDIGKLEIPSDIIKKPSKLTNKEFEIIKTHPIKGFHILADQSLDNRVKLACLQHHEKCNGSGYPLRLKRERISEFSKIVTIADVYEAMTARRVYREPLCPFEVIRIFEKEGYEKYETKYLLVFLENIVNTYINNPVLLSDGRVGEVVMVNKLDLANPLVRLEEGFIDLSKEPNIKIEKII